LRLLIECTYVYDHPHRNSGIQRVVRNIVNKMKGASDVVEAIPIVLKYSNIYEVKYLMPGSFCLYLSNLIHTKLIQLQERYWLLFSRITQRRIFQYSSKLKQALLLAFKFLDLGFDLSIFCVSLYNQAREIGDRIVELPVKSDDVLVLLDSSWHSNCLPQIAKLKAQGIGIISVLYDLIPLTHPQFCEQGLVVIFEKWFQWISRTADGYMAISQFTRDLVRQYIAGTRGDASESTQWFDYFQLGSELDLVKDTDVVRDSIRDVFKNGSPVYLTVSTIEPRKNHAYLIDAFDMLWEKNANVSLCFVGKTGWKSKALIQRIKHHPEYNRRFFVINDASDAELEYCYLKSRSLVFPSHMEGFGLPLVEAMQRGLPAMASDIAVFREVGADFMAYFDIQNPENLANLILRYEETGMFPASKRLTQWSWLNWEESTRQFLTKIVSHVVQPRNNLG
jgi:O-antigen biosynthesis alpha-1,2-rhamnosyltransferase